MITKQWLACALGLLLVLFQAGPVLAEDPPWPGGSPLVTLGANAQRPGVAVSSTALTAVWGSTSPKGVVLRQRALLGSTWDVARTVASGPQDYWLPQVAYDGTMPVVTWLQGTLSEPFTTTVMLRDMPTSPPAPVTAIADLNVFDSAQRLAISGSGVRHLIVGANRQQGTYNDLYYTFKRPADPAWATPQVIITCTQVITNALGSVYWVDMALSPDGNTVHVVWEQHAHFQLIGSARTIWHLSGAWNGNGVNWGTPQRLSTATSSVRPSVAVDDTNTAHVVWAQVTYLAQTGPGYIRYRRVAPGGVLSEELYVDNRAVQMNAQLPTMTYPVVAILEEAVCVAWHGYRLEAYPSEEVFLRCAAERGQAWLTPAFNASNTYAELSIFPHLASAASGALHLVWEEMVLGAKQEVVYRSGRAIVHSVMLPLIMRSYR